MLTSYRYRKYFAYEYTLEWYLQYTTRSSFRIKRKLFEKNVPKTQSIPG